MRIEYSYKGRNRSGAMTSGKITSTSEAEVVNYLLSKDITPISINASKSGADFLFISFSRGTVSVAERVMFCRQMYSLVTAGVPLIAALNKLADSIKSRPLKIALQDIADNLTSGHALSQCMEKFPKIFTPLFISLIRAGEETGRLDEAFLRLSEYLELEASVRRRIKTVIRYPLLVISAIVVAIVVINMLVVPAFASLFERFGANLPLPTRLLMATSDFFLNYWFVLLIVIILLAIGARFFVRSTSGSLQWDRMKLKIPLVGNIILRILLARFAFTFTMISRSGMSIDKGLILVSESVGNKFLQKKLRDMEGAVNRGESLLASAKASKLFTPLVMQMIAVGEESGTLDNMFEQVAKFYEREVDYDIKKLGDRLEPILLLIVAVMVLIVALGVFLPMWNIAKLNM